MEGPEGALTSCHVRGVWQTYTENIFIYYPQNHEKRDKSKKEKKKHTTTALVILTLDIQ